MRITHVDHQIDLRQDSCLPMTSGAFGQLKRLNITMVQFQACLGGCTDFKVICSGMIANVFQPVGYPIVPIVQLYRKEKLNDRSTGTSRDIRIFQEIILLGQPVSPMRLQPAEKAAGMVGTLTFFGWTPYLSK